MNLIRLDLFSNMMSLRNAMDRLFEDSFVRPGSFWPDIESSKLPVDIDVYQTDNKIVMKAAIPGVKLEEVDISLTGDMLTIKGEHKDEQEVKGNEYIQREYHYGSFSRSIQIPVSVDNDKTEAVLNNPRICMR